MSAKNPCMDAAEIASPFPLPTRQAGQLEAALQEPGLDARGWQSLGFGFITELFLAA